jgi:UDP-glucose 4-epimerase
MAGKALITGGAGFFGAHLAGSLLEQAWRVDLLDNFARGARDRRVSELCERGAILREADLMRAEALTELPKDYTHVFHFAAVVGVGNVLERPYEVLRENVQGLEHVLTFAKSLSGMKRLLFASTSEVYAGTLQHFTLPIPTPESTPLAVTDVSHARASYMLSKIYGEALCHQSALPFTIVRPHNIYGPRMGMSHVIPELLRKAHDAPAGGELQVFSISHRRTFCYVADAIRMIELAAQKPECERQTLNVGTESPEVTMADLAALIARVVGKRLRIVPGPDTPGSPPRRCPDMRKTARLTGHTAAVGLEEGVRSTYQAYRPLFAGTG